MNFASLNPFIRSVSLYEKINRTEECIAYDCRMIYLISGDISAVVDGVSIGHMSPGHLLYIPSGVAYKLKGKYLRAVVVTFDLDDKHSEIGGRISPVLSADFKRELCHSCEGFAPFDRYIHLEDFEGERDLFLSLCDIYTSAQGFYLARISALVKQTLIKIAELCDEHALPSRMVEALDQYIRENCSDEISNTEIGAIFGYHPFYISKVLKDKKGVTLRQYIISYRLKRSCSLLQFTNKSISEIAEETGFTDASYFTKTFKATFGVTPKDYRGSFSDDFI